MIKKQTFAVCIAVLCAAITFGQLAPKKLQAKRTNAIIKIDGNLEEAAWKEAVPATDFIEWRPNFGATEDPSCRTEIYLLYDNTSVYIAGYCHERTKDSVSKELVGRDQVGVNDYVGVIFDTYLDKINGVGFYVTPLGEQFDAKYSNSNNGEDPSWNAVWSSEARLVEDGWTFEMRIPYSALRFVSKQNQTWGLNITRNRKKVGKQYMWNPVNPKVSGLMNQEGEWTGIEKINAPIRLSFSPYFSTYLNHYPYKTKGVKDWTSNVNGGMDVKYGINDAFTLDMTLIPDFGQVQSDNQVLNLTPFEVKYNENRPFFTEGTELFSKGNLFYSRRVGSTPLHFGDVYSQLAPNEQVIDNPLESKLLNATKVSGRTKSGLGVGLFNAVTKPMYATIEDDNGNKRKVQTAPLTNYNIIVFDQTLKNNSAVSFINTNTWRSGTDYDANVSAALFDLSNKKNTYNWSGKFAVSQLFYPGKKMNGYSHELSFAKKGGRWNYQVGQEIADDKYNINDMGILFNNNFVDHFLWTSYRWLKPTKWYNRIQINYNAYYSLLYKNVPNQKVNSKFQAFNTNVNGNIQFKNQWWAGMYIGYAFRGNDFYEPREIGYSFLSPRRIQINPWFETNETRKYYVSFNYFIGIRNFQLFTSPNHQINFSQRYRFNDKFSLRQDINFNPVYNDAGFYQKYYEDAGNGNSVLKDIIFSRRNRKTVENVITAKYNFNNKSGITFRARHYWSQVEQKQLYDLKTNGTLVPTTHNNISMENRNFNIFNVDATYTLQFAPGSFVNIVWKSQAFLSDNIADGSYFKNFNHTISEPQNNNLSLKIIYYLDYLDFKKWRKKKPL
jgi:hypothetical protein